VTVAAPHCRISSRTAENENIAHMPASCDCAERLRKKPVAGLRNSHGTNLAQLRRLEPDPVAELSRGTAASRGIGEGDWVAITTPHGRVRARVQLNSTLADGIVAARHGCGRPARN